MNEIIVKMPKLPKVKYRKCKHMNSKKLPGVKLPVLETSPGVVMRGLTTGLIRELTSYKKVELPNGCNSKAETPEKKPIGAGRGVIVYGKVSNMGRMAESAVPAKRGKHTPYKPNPEMHTLWAISDMRTGLI